MKPSKSPRAYLFFLALVPASSEVGTHDVIVRVQDGYGGVALQPFHVTVRGPDASSNQERSVPVAYQSAPPMR